MKRSRKQKVFLAAGVAMTAAAAAVLWAVWPNETRKIDAQFPPPGSQDMASLIEAGRYAAIAGDCVACHTAAKGQPFAGGLPLASPIGTIYSTNITPDKATGIGEYSLDDFDRAIRHGIAKDGSTLYPAMPYPSYARTSDADVRALYAYFMHGVQPATAKNRQSDITWPLSMRWPLGAWRKLFAPSSGVTQTESNRYDTAQIARGAYLVQGLGHCGTCHTPRAISLQERALDESSPLYLAGGQTIDGWYAVSLRGDQAGGLGRWTQSDIVELLRTGRNRQHAVVGAPMADVVTHSSQHMSDEDLQAVAAYLKSIGPGPGESASFKADATTAKELAAGVESGRGAQLYVDNCAACHRTDGKGYPSVFPTIACNSTVLADRPDSLIRLILGGSELPSTSKAPSNLGMPGFDWRLSDEEAALLATFVRQSWGNNASQATRSAVASVRREIEEERKHAAAGTATTSR